MKVELSLYEVWELHGAMEMCEGESCSSPRGDMKHLFEAENADYESWTKLKTKLEEILNRAMAGEKDSHGQEEQIGTQTPPPTDDR
jgi:predicted secreted protein